VQADTFIQCAVRQIPVGDAPRLDSTVGCRYYQVTGPATGINTNTPACTDQRCIRTFSTNALFGGAGFGGYNCNSESSGTYSPPPSEPSDQVFYCLIDAEADSGTCNHIGYYTISGQLVNNDITSNPGDARTANCAGTVTQNCFTAGDPSNSDQTPLTSTYPTFGAVPHQVRSIGGFSPVPTVRVSPPGASGCGSQQVRVTWDDPIPADPLMKNGVPSPIQGVDLYRNDAACAACPDGSTGWVRTSTAAAPTGEYGPAAGASGDCVDIPASGSGWFALTVRVKGPGPSPSSVLETRLSGSSQCVSALGTAGRIVSFGARYAGRGTVDLSWTTGTEGGVQGFYVTRATTPTGPYTRVSDMVGVTGDYSHYAFTDHIRTSLGRVLVYRLEIVHSDGTIELSGSTTVTTPGPKMNKLGGGH